jgi:hypothetical protein
LPVGVEFAGPGSAARRRSIGEMVVVGGWLGGVCSQLNLGFEERAA